MHASSFERMNWMHDRTRFALALLSLSALDAARAQCPDGSPPPCRTRQVAVAPRRVNPPLDERTWIVVPFDNLAKNSEAEWMRGASVNLLYLGMSRWTDVRVIDDERVADLMREVPEANNASSLTLNAGLAVAKRAGAGKLVMGDVLKIGNRTAVTAKVFDVKSGQRVRSVREETVVQDSVMPMFGKLAEKVLNIAAPQGASVNVVGTTNMGAYKEYAEGMQSLNLFDIPKAREHLERALQIDSTFALAHAKLSVLGGWVTPNDPANRVHAEAAARLSGSLPPREKTLINSNVLFARREYARACEGFRSLLKNDSTDVDAWYGLGDCLYHDLALEPTNGDTTRIRWRANVNESVRAFLRALELDPTYHLAYQHVVDAYSAQFRGGPYCTDPSHCKSYLTVLRPSGDSLLTIPFDPQRDTTAFRVQMESYVRTRARKVSLDHAKVVAEQWVAANPAEHRAQFNLGGVLLLLGQVAAADSVLSRAIISDSGQASAVLLLQRLELAIKLWRTAQARSLYDTVRSHPIALQGPITTANIAALAAPDFGRMTEYDSVVASGLRLAGLAGNRERFVHAALRQMVGLPADSLLPFERAVFDAVASSRGTGNATRAILYSLTFGLRVPREQWPPIDTTVPDPRVPLVAAFMQHDTTKLRQATRRLDSLSSVFAAALVPDTGVTLVAAEGYLGLRDSINALRMTRRWLDSILPYSSIVLATGSTIVQPLIPRAMILRADLAAALGERDEARLWYKRLLDLWAKPEPEFQPLIDRVRRSYGAVGGS